MSKIFYVTRLALPGCPVGRVFKPTYDKSHFYHSQTTDESISGKFESYRFSREFMDTHHKFFTRFEETNEPIDVTAIDILNKYLPISIPPEFDVNTVKGFEIPIETALRAMECYAALKQLKHATLKQINP